MTSPLSALLLPTSTTTPLEKASDDVMASTMPSNSSRSTASPPAVDAYFELIWYEIIVPILYGMVTILGVTGNSLVIYVIMTRERMRTVTNLLLLNLAVADLCFVIVIPPPTAYVMAANRWPFGDVPCRMMHYLVNVTAYVTVYTLVLIAVIRYMTIVHTTRTARFRTPRQVVAAIAGVWILMLAVNVPVLVSYGIKKFPVDPDVTTDLAVEMSTTMSTSLMRTEEADVVTNLTAVVGELRAETEVELVEVCDHVDQRTAQQLFVTFFAFAYVLPLCIIAGFSLGIVRHITRHKAPVTTSSVSSSGSKSIGSARSAAVGGGGGGGAGGGGGGTIATTSTGGSTQSGISGSARKTSHSANRKRQAGLTLVLVVVMFAVFWLPVHVHLLMHKFDLIPTDGVYEAISVLWNLLAYFNSCVNPIIYNRTSKEFRDAFVEACRCGRAGPTGNRRQGSQQKKSVVVGEGRTQLYVGYAQSPEPTRTVNLVTRLTVDSRQYVSADGGLCATASGGTGSDGNKMQRSLTTSERTLIACTVQRGGKDVGDDVKPTQEELSRRKSDLVMVPSAMTS